VADALFQATVVENKWILQKPTLKQEEFLKLDCLEALYGGAAGGAKSSCILMAALQYVDFPGYNAIILRRTYRDLALSGALMDRSKEWLSGSEARWNEIQHCWAFPKGAKLQFGYLESEADKYRYQGAEFQGIFIDELTQFTESQYTYLFSRLRRLENSDVPLRMWSATNPGGLGHNWVKQRFIIEGQTYGRAFVPARLIDNPYIDRESYIRSLQNLDPVTRRQLLNGDWEAKETYMFKRDWFQTVKDYPHDCSKVSVWDLAKTEEGKAKDPDYTANCLATMQNGVLYIIRVLHFRGSPNQIEQAMRNCASQDGVTVPVHIEEERGAAGKNLVDQLRRNVLLGHAVVGEPPSGEKSVRAMPLASAAEAGNVRLVEGVWNSAFLDEIEAFPEGNHDDQVDVAAYAYNALCNVARPPRVKHA
jgi:predicted phage terminase large subunit-like protein